MLITTYVTPVDENPFNHMKNTSTAKGSKSWLYRDYRPACKTRAEKGDCKIMPLEPRFRISVKQTAKNLFQIDGTVEHNNYIYKRSPNPDDAAKTVTSTHWDSCYGP